MSVQGLEIISSLHLEAKKKNFIQFSHYKCHSDVLLTICELWELKITIIDGGDGKYGPFLCNNH